MPALLDLIEPNNLRPVLAAYDLARELAADLRADAAFGRTLWRAFGPARHRRPAAAPDVFGPVQPLDVPALAGTRIAVVASGGSGATASLVGVRRAFEEARLEPVLISACSGSVLFAALWACGLSADDIARFWLELPTAGYVDPRWGAVVRGAGRRFRGTAGLVAGQAIERAFRGRIGDRRLGETRIPLAAVAWNIDENRIEFLSSSRTPDVPVALAARIAISIPILVEPVRLDGTWYGDGGIVDIFPTAPLADAEPIELVIGTNCYLPRGFTGMSVAGWHDAPWSVLRAAGQLRYAVYLELARAHVRALGDRLELLEPVDHREVRGARFYDSFLDRTAWPSYMRAGRAVARAALARRGRGAGRTAA